MVYVEKSSVELAKELRLQIGHYVQLVAEQAKMDYYAELKSLAQRCIERFIRQEKKIWEELGNYQGKDTTYPQLKRGSHSKKLNIGFGKEPSGEVNFNSELHKFTNRTREMKNYTGYIIRFDNKVIQGRNRILSKYISQSFLKGVNGKGTDYALPLENVAKGYGVKYNKRATVDRRWKNSNPLGFNIAISVFTDSEHAFYVDNPNPHPDKQRQLTQGTGWFRLYVQELAQRWMQIVIGPLMDFRKEVETREQTIKGQEKKLKELASTEVSERKGSQSGRSDMRGMNIASRYITYKQEENGRKREKTLRRIIYRVKQEGLKYDIPVILYTYKKGSSHGWKYINKRRGKWY